MKTLLCLSLIFIIASCQPKSQPPMMHEAGPMENSANPHFEGPQQKNNEKRVNREEQIEQIKLQKIAFMTDELALTLEESQSFWPLYNQYWDQYMKLLHSQSQTNRRISKMDSPTASDVDSIACYYERQAAMTREWASKFATVIPMSKAIKVFTAEEKFKNYLIRKGPWGRDDKPRK